MVGKKKLLLKKTPFLFFSTGKKITKFFEKIQLFSKSLLKSAVEELFAYIFGIYKKLGGNNPSILTLYDLVDVAT